MRDKESILFSLNSAIILCYYKNTEKCGRIPTAAKPCTTHSIGSVNQLWHMLQSNLNNPILLQCSIFKFKECILLLHTLSSSFLDTYIYSKLQRCALSTVFFSGLLHYTTPGGKMSICIGHDPIVITCRSTGFQPFYQDVLLWVLSSRKHFQVTGLWCP